MELREDERPALAAGPESAAKDLTTHTLSAGELVAEIAAQAKRLVNEEMRLAGVELRAQAKASGVGGGLAGGGAALAFAGLIVLLIAAAVGLGTVLPLWGAGLIVGGAAIVLGLVTLAGGFALVKRTRGPRQTAETLKEDRSWMKDLMRGARSRTRASA